MPFLFCHCCSSKLNSDSTFLVLDPAINLKKPEASTIDYAELDPDVRLMLQVREDNAAAFEELVSRYQVRLVTVFENMVGRRSMAEDFSAGSVS